MNQLSSAPNRYLAARVSTASQPELQLMLLDGALRFGQQAQVLWGAADQAAECDRLLARTLDIAEELTRSVAGGKSESARRLEEEYAFAFRQLAAAQINGAAAALEAALKVMSIERETWRLACDKFRSEMASTTPAPASSFTVSSSGGAGLSLRG